MSTDTERDPTGNRMIYARLLLVGAVVGALVALTTSFVLTPPFGPAASTPEEVQTTPDGQTPEETTPQIPAEFSAAAGSCLTWDGDDAADIRTVSCAEPHLFEVTSVVDVSDTYSASAPAPEADQWQDIVDERCNGPSQAYLDNGLDPEGKFQISAIFPNELEWGAGQRELHCGLWRPAPGGELQELTQPVSSVDQSDVWEEGTCLALEGKGVGDPIDCSEAHSYEMVGVVDLSEEFDEGYPSEDEQMSWLDEQCSEVVDSYSDGLDLEENDLILTWDTREQASWDAGSHLVNCKVGAMLDDESGLAPVTGSIAEETEGDQDSGADQDADQDENSGSGSGADSDADSDE